MLDILFYMYQILHDYNYILGKVYWSVQNPTVVYDLDWIYQPHWFEVFMQKRNIWIENRENHTVSVERDGKKEVLKQSNYMVKNQTV